MIYYYQLALLSFSTKSMNLLNQSNFIIVDNYGEISCDRSCISISNQFRIFCQIPLCIFKFISCFLFSWYWFWRNHCDWCGHVINPFLFLRLYSKVNIIIIFSLRTRLLYQCIHLYHNFGPKISNNFVQYFIHNISV